MAWSTRHNRGRPRFPPVQQGTEVQSDGVQGSCCSAVKRREAIAGLSALLAASGWSLPNDAQALPDFINSTAAGLIGTGFDLRAVLSDGQPRISSPGLSWSPSKRQKQLFYPAWMEGTWDVTAEFAGFYAPLGSRFVSSSTPGFTKASILAMADAGATPVSYQAR